jgi:hypothetical protein
MTEITRVSLNGCLVGMAAGSCELPSERLHRKRVLRVDLP